MKIKIVLFAVLVFAFSIAASAQNTNVNVQFARGASSATKSGSITGYRSVTYIIKAGTGQTMSVDLKGSDRVSFYIHDPSGNFVDDNARDTRNWSSQLEVGGTYKVVVSMPRSEARRPGSARYTLTVAIH